MNININIVIIHQVHAYTSCIKFIHQKLNIYTTKVKHQIEA
jgi:hypothetical protein